MTVTGWLRIGFLGFCFIFAMILLMSSCVYISPGNVGVLVHRSGGGVDPKPLSVGYHYIMPVMEEVDEYPVYMQTLVLTKSLKEGRAENEEINLNSVEGQPVSVDVSLSFELDPRLLSVLYTTFRTDIVTIQHTFVKQTIRQALQEVVGQVEIANLIGKDKAQIVVACQKLISERLKEYGFVVKQFTLNEVRPPESIVQAIAQKNVMQQEALRSQNQLQKVQFEAQQKVAEAEGLAKAKVVQAEADGRAIFVKAKAQADGNELLSKSITDKLIQYEIAKSYKGDVPMVTGGALPFLNLSGFLEKKQ